MARNRRCSSSSGEPWFLIRCSVRDHGSGGHYFSDSLYWGWHVALLLDEDPSHTAKGSLRVAEGMTLLWLPKRSPELNPMDTLWGQGKDVISADKQYGTVEEHVDRFLKYLYGLSGREALHTSGVLSRDFWLRRMLSKKFCGSA